MTELWLACRNHSDRIPYFSFYKKHGYKKREAEVRQNVGNRQATFHTLT